MPNNPNYGTMKKCKNCGKEFFVPAVNDWTFKFVNLKQGGSNVTHYFCRWNCMRAWERIHKPEKKPKEGEWEL